MPYRIVLNLFPRPGESVDGPAHAQASHEVLRRFTLRFSDRFERMVPRRFPDLPPDPNVGYVDCATPDKGMLHEVDQWIRHGADGAAERVGEMRVGIGISAADDPRTVARARWVDLLAEPVKESGAAYPHACGRCGRPDAERIPDPFPLDERSARKPAELLRADNAVYLVKPRALSLFQAHALGQFDAGAVVVGGRHEPHAEWRWLRPQSHLDGRAIWHGVDPCPGCGVPGRWQRRLDQYPDQPQFLRTFGPPDLQFARIDSFPRRLKTTPVSPAAALVSGRFYAALLENKVKGLCPPAEIFISVRPDSEEPTLRDD